MKAVVWTDAFQTLVLLAGVVAVVIQVEKLPSKIEKIYPLVIDASSWCNFPCVSHIGGH